MSRLTPGAAALHQARGEAGRLRSPLFAFLVIIANNDYGCFRPRKQGNP